MKCLITGSSGLIGTALMRALRAAGHQVTPLVRKADGPPGSVTWNPLAADLDSALWADADVILHLAGESLAQGRWTPAKKKRMEDSRIQTTAILAENLARLPARPRAFFCASAVGYYGNRGDEILTEDSACGAGYLADLCRRWEQAAAPAAAAGIRVVNLRLGVVLSAAGGALKKMLTPFRLGLGGKIGSGRQYVSWISLDDVARAVMHLLEHSQLTGPVNVVAPQSVTNRQLTKTLGGVLHRPTLFPLPAFAAWLAFGEMADEVLLTSARVFPRRLQADGFVFHHPELQRAMKDALGR